MTSKHKTRPHVGVAALVKKDGKILFGKRVGEHGNDTWSVPGGYLEFGETFEQCAIRETMEETGVKIVDPKFIAAINNIFDNESHHSITIFMTASYKSNEPKVIEPDKFTDVAWYDIKNLPEPLFLPVKQLKQSIPELFV